MELGRLIGCLPHFEDTSAHSSDEQSRAPVDVMVEASLALEGQTVDGPIQTSYTPAGPHGAAWGSSDEADVITFAVKV